MFEQLPLWQAVAAFAAAAGVVGVAGAMMSGLADRLADLTKLGEAVAGAVLLGAATSLSGAVVSVTAALDGRASLAFSNGVGGIAAQTLFLAVADILWRRGNLEHAAADLANLFQAALLALMLCVPLFAFVGPEIATFGVHPASWALVALYALGLVATGRVRSGPMWRAVETRETRIDRPDEDPEADPTALRRVVLRFLGAAVILGAAGWTIAGTGARIADGFGVSETAVGALMTAVATSLPELVTTVAAVRRGAAQLAIGGVIGGNVFDMLFLSLSDAVYPGSLYHAIGRADLLWPVAGLAMTATLLLGLIARQRRGPANIGVESVALIALYALAAAAQVASG
jgi:cation:H+ antiporter